MKILFKKPLRFIVITTLCLIAVTLFVVIGCKNPKDTLITENNLLQDTKWKLVGIVDAQGNTRILEPGDCARCYILTFNTDSTFIGNTAANRLTGCYKVDYKTGALRIPWVFSTNIFDLLDARQYLEILRNHIHSFSLQENELRLHYKENEAEYYLLYEPSSELPAGPIDLMECK